MQLKIKRLILHSLLFCLSFYAGHELFAQKTTLSNSKKEKPVIKFSGTGRIEDKYITYLSSKKDDLSRWAEIIKSNNSDAFAREFIHLKETGDWMALQFLCTEWGKKFPRQAMNLLLPKYHKLDYFSLPAIFSSWANQDPESAAAYYMENRELMYHCDHSGLLSLKQKNHFLDHLMFSWASQDHANAWRWLNQLNKQEIAEYSSAFLDGLAKNNSDLLPEYVKMLPDYSLHHKDYLKKILFSLIESGHEDLISTISKRDSIAQELTLALEQDIKKKKIINDIEVLVENDLEEAKKSVPLVSSEYQREAFAEICTAIKSKEGFEAVLIWLASVPDCNERTIQNWFYGWAQDSPVNAINWIKEQTKSSVRDYCITSLVNHHSNNHPFAEFGDQIALSNLISDTSSREEYITRSIIRWQDTDAEAVQNWRKQNSNEDTSNTKESFINAQ